MLCRCYAHVSIHLLCPCIISMYYFHFVCNAMPMLREISICYVHVLLSFVLHLDCNAMPMLREISIHLLCPCITFICFAFSLQCYANAMPIHLLCPCITFIFFCNLNAMLCRCYEKYLSTCYVHVFKVEKLLAIRLWFPPLYFNKNQ